MIVKFFSLILLLLALSSVAHCFNHVRIVDDGFDQELEEEHLITEKPEHHNAFQLTGSGGGGETEGTTAETTEGSGEGEETTAPTSTTSTPTTTTTSPTTTRPPNQVPDLSELIYEMDLSLSILVDCVTAKNCSNYTKEIENVLTVQFQDLLGYRDISGIEYRSRSASYQYYASGDTIVFYSVQYDLETAIEYEANITSSTEKVFESLKGETIDGIGLNDTYLDNDAMAQLNASSAELQSIENNICLFSGAEDFCEFGHGCVRWNETVVPIPENSSAVVYGSTCQQKCLTYRSNCDEDYGVCVINTNGNAECACGDNSLQISSSNCFPQNNIIFICSVAGGILLIAVIVLTANLLCRSSYEKEVDRLSQVSAMDILNHERYGADDGFAMPRASRAEDRESGGSDAYDDNNLPAGSSTFLGNPKPDRKDTPNHRYHNAHHNKAFDWDDTERVQLEDMDGGDRRRSRQPSQRPRDVPRPRDAYDPYYEELVGSETYRDFKPQLDKVDSEKVYSFRRPMFTSQREEGSSKGYDRRWEDTD